MWLIQFYDALWRKLYQWSLKVQAQRQKKISLLANKKRELASNLHDEALNLDTEAEDLEKLR
ncbi:MAG: hypothetical protein WCS17_08715 [Prevotella sp.]